jgi:hypothetical protein
VGRSGILSKFWSGLSRVITYLTHSKWLSSCFPPLRLRRGGLGGEDRRCDPTPKPSPCTGRGIDSCWASQVSQYPFKAGSNTRVEMALRQRPMKIPRFQPSLTRHKYFLMQLFPALKGRAKFIRRYAAKTGESLCALQCADFQPRPVNAETAALKRADSSCIHLPVRVFFRVIDTLLLVRIFSPVRREPRSAAGKNHQSSLRTTI